jgi:transglutaminase-like putative cysteine protease
MIEPIGDFARVDEAELLRPTPFLQSDAPEVIRFAEGAVAGATDPIEQGVRLFYAVRDGIRYDPYRIPLAAEGYRATAVLREQAAFCIPKANLLAAAARVVGIPSAVGYADVKNHLCTEKLRKAMGTDLFIYHGFTVLRLGGKWLKATPAFNLGLCERFEVLPLEFDGRSDALLHPYDTRNRKHMEYVRDRGCFADFPFEEILSAFKAQYPAFFEAGFGLQGRFEEEKPLTS